MSLLEVNSTSRRVAELTLEPVAVSSQTHAAAVEGAREQGYQEGYDAGRLSADKERAARDRENETKLQQQRDALAEKKASIERLQAELKAAVTTIIDAQQAMQSRFDASLHAATLAMAARLLTPLANDPEYIQTLVDELRSRYQPDRLSLTVSAELFDDGLVNGGNDGSLDLQRGQSGQLPEAKWMRGDTQFGYSLKSVVDALLAVANSAPDHGVNE